MNVQKRNGVSIYCLSSGPAIPEWLGDRARRNLSKKDEAIRRRIELIQDFQMPSSSSKLVQSMDGRYVMVAGTYPPRIRCYDLHEMTMKFERYVNAEVVDIIMLGEDFGKLALLQEDRTISFHANYGAHESVKIPTFGRAMSYEPTTCEVLIAAKGSKIFRINLEEGRHSEPWSFDPSSMSSGDVSALCIAVNQAYPVACVGCEDGIVRFWDNRSPDNLRPMLKLDVQSATSGLGYAVANEHKNINEISAVAYDPTGMFMAAGTTGGLVALYDVRSSRPLHVQEHKHGLPINTLKFHSGSGMILSSDQKLLKIWRYRSSGDLGASQNRIVESETAAEPSGDSKVLGSVRVNIETTGKVSHFLVAGDESDPRGEKSGVILCATDQPKMESYYIPSLGIAPKWCSFLESVTEELVERDLSRSGASGNLQAGEEAVYENYKFVSRDDLDQLGISHLIGTPLLRGYMHGFFMDINLYHRVKAVANPFEYEEYRKKKIKERLEAKRGSRIAVKSDSAKSRAAVNPELADRMQNKASATTKAGKAAGQVLTDDRFGSLFTNPDYQIDEGDENFKLRNPSGVAAAKAAVKRKKDNLDSDDEDDEVEEEIVPIQEGDFEDGNEADDAEEGVTDGVSSGGSDSEDDGFRGAKVRGDAYDEMKALKVQKRKAEQPRKIPKKREVTMQEADIIGGKGAMELAMGLSDSVHAKRAMEAAAEKCLPLSKRLALKAEQDPNADNRLKGGSKEIKYVPRDNRKSQMESADGNARGRRQRRGMKDLKRGLL